MKARAEELSSRDGPLMGEEERIRRNKEEYDDRVLSCYKWHRAVIGPCAPGRTRASWGSSASAASSRRMGRRVRSVVACGETTKQNIRSTK